jgi:hypothetical protein
MQYMLLLYVSERPALGTPEAADMFGAVMAFHGQCRDRGVLVASAPLEEPDTATTVRVRDGQTLNSDGPFAETTEWLGGYFILECRDLDEALELAAMCPTATDGSVEVRPLLQTPSPPA